MKAILRFSKISPKKANLVAGLVRNKKVTDALTTLKFTHKKAAGILYKTIASAAANAEQNFKQKKEELYVKEIIVTQGPMHKRHIAISKGRAHPILKKTSHITVKVGVAEQSQQEEVAVTKEKELETPVETKEETNKE